MTKVPSYFFCEKFCESCSSMYFSERGEEKSGKASMYRNWWYTFVSIQKECSSATFWPLWQWRVKNKQTEMDFGLLLLLCSFSDPLGLSFKLFFFCYPFLHMKEPLFFPRCIYSQIGKNVPFLSLGEIPLSELTLSKGKLSMLPLPKQSVHMVHCITLAMDPETQTNSVQLRSPIS